VGAQGAAQPVPASGELKQLAAIAVTTIDIATMRRELAERKTRRYIGASGIGETCQAYHALSLRGFPSDPPNAKFARIFRDGHRIEGLVVQDLIEAGHEVTEVDPATRQQWEYTSHGDHHVCHLDGFIRLAGQPGGTPLMTLEVKSMGRDMFRKFRDKGVRVSHPEYLDQAIDQLGLVRSKLGTPKPERCFFIGYCKDNAEYHVEIIEFDQEHYDVLSERVDAAVFHHSARRESAYEKAFKCSGNEHMPGCFKRTSCWHPTEPEDKRCWHCAHASPEMSGGKEWACAHPNKVRQSVGDGTPCADFQLFKVTRHGA
jgi:hypothetical protein